MTGVGGQRPQLSIIFAVLDGPSAAKAITDSLSAIEPQLDPLTEVILATNSLRHFTADLRRRSPSIQVLLVPDASFVPDLWQRGIEESGGEIVAITAAGFIPRSDWVRQIKSAHDSTAAAVGGAIEKLEPAGILSWAVYFCRYSQFMLPLAGGTAAEIAGENASYARSALEACRTSWRNGFWEPSVHAEILSQGGTLTIDPAIVVEYSSTFGFGDFMSQRFWHGRQFGSSRTRRLSSMLRLAYLAATPIVPVLLVSRIARRVISKERYLTKLVLCVPLLTLFLCAWAAGEASGYLIPQRTEAN